MRLEIIGAGPVSDYEQSLMTRVSGGGGTGKKAALELLNHWKRRAKSKMDLYNNTLKGDLYIKQGY